MRSLNLRQIKLRSGEEYRDEIELELEPFELGGERYLPVPDRVPAELAITKATTGTVFDLRFTTRLHGPCYRCLEDAVLEVPITGREYQATNPDGADGAVHASTRRPAPALAGTPRRLRRPLVDSRLRQWRPRRDVPPLAAARATRRCTRSAHRLGADDRRRRIP